MNAPLTFIIAAYGLFGRPIYALLPPWRRVMGLDAEYLCMSLRERERERRRQVPCKINQAIILSHIVGHNPLAHSPLIFSFIIGAAICELGKTCPLPRSAYIKLNSQRVDRTNGTLDKKSAPKVSRAHYFAIRFNSSLLL